MLYGKQELPFRPMFGKPFIMKMADKIIEMDKNNMEVASSMSHLCGELVEEWGRGAQPAAKMNTTCPGES